MPSDIKNVQIVTEVGLGQLAEEIGHQAGRNNFDGPTYREVIEFIRLIDENIGDSVFTRGLVALGRKLEEELDAF